MNNQDIIAFFDRWASDWDADMVRDDAKIGFILDAAHVVPGVRVLDVACGTGVLFPDYLKRGVASVTGIDIAPEMVKIAAAKFPEVTVLCGDVESTQFTKQFDRIMVYNAFPHFPDPAKLVQTLAGLTKAGGRLSVAHGMSRAMLIKHHERASTVSIDLIHEEELKEIFSQWFDVDVVISNEQMYQVSGVRKG